MFQRLLRRDLMPAALAVLAATLTVGIVSDWHRQDPNPTGANLDRVLDEQTSWLIVDGAIVPGPYEIIVLEDGIEINGRRLLEPAAPASPITVSARTKAQHQAIEAVHMVFPLWAAEDGEAAASAAAVMYMLAQREVVEAEFVSPHTLRVKFRGERYDEFVTLESHPAEVPPEQVRQSYLQDQGEALDHWLHNGALVIMQGSVLMATPEREGKTLLSKLVAIIRSDLTPLARLDAIDDLLPDGDMANAIAQHLDGNHDEP